MSIFLNIGNNNNINFLKDFIYSKFSYLILIQIGIFPRKIISQKIQEIYKKYLGNDYDIYKKRDYCTIISNHIGWIENFYYNYLFKCGYVGSKNYNILPLINKIVYI